jgi:hypothetical protein
MILLVRVVPAFEDVSMTTELDDEQVVRDATESLKRRFEDRDEAEIEAIVRQEFAQLRERPVRDYLSVLTERAAKDRLRTSPVG